MRLSQSDLTGPAHERMNAAFNFGCGVRLQIGPRDGATLMGQQA